MTFQYFLAIENPSLAARLGSDDYCIANESLWITDYGEMETERDSRCGER